MARLFRGLQFHRLLKAGALCTLCLFMGFRVLCVPYLRSPVVACSAAFVDKIDVIYMSLVSILLNSAVNMLQGLHGLPCGACELCLRGRHVLKRKA